MGRNARGIKRGRHHQDLQVIAKAALDIECQRKAQIRIERAFVEFIEDHETGAREFRIRLQAAGEDAFRHNLDARSG